MPYSCGICKDAVLQGRIFRLFCTFFAGQRSRRETSYPTEIVDQRSFYSKSLFAGFSGFRRTELFKKQLDADDFMTDLTTADKNTFSGECVFETKASHIVFIFPHYISYLETLPIHLLKHYNSLFFTSLSFSLSATSPLIRHWHGDIAKYKM